MFLEKYLFMKNGKVFNILAYFFCYDGKGNKLWIYFVVGGYYIEFRFRTAFGRFLGNSFGKKE